MSDVHNFNVTVGNSAYTIETGKFAAQAGGAVTLRVGDTMLLATATMSKTTRDISFFPLSVDFEEKMYAKGKIPGSFFRREARPSTSAILTSRLTDRPLRPLFPKGMRNEVQVIVTALSSDDEHHLDITCVNAASMAMTISDIPWNGPVAAVRIGRINDEFVVNPTISEMEDSTLDLRLAGTAEAVIMVEAGADEVPEDVLGEALILGHKAIQPLIELQNEMRAKVGKEKREVELKTTDAELEANVLAKLGDKVKGAATITEREKRNSAMEMVRDVITEQFTEEDPDIDLGAVREIIGAELKKEIRSRILHEGIRPDGRTHTDIRALSAETTLLPRAHGSGFFKRGETHCLSVVTLGTPREAQKLDGLYPEESRRFMLHYNFPPFSTGETWFLRGPKRREIGHGMLGRTALSAVMPSEEEFPYTIRIVSEILSSNGSTSQASICAGTLALMDCGVPIKNPVAGIAMGMITDGDNYTILSDIQGMEDHLGDMDFKVAGTKDGVTALQMDIKISGISPEMMTEALAQAHTGRLQILDVMTAEIPEPRAEMSEWAPSMETIKIESKKIGAVIGKGGATIRKIEEEFEVSVDIQEDGTIFIAGVGPEKSKAAIEFIETLTKGVEAGQIYTGKVVRIEPFGAFVELLPGIDGLVHISQISTERIESVQSAVQLDDEIMVMVTDVNPVTEKVRLSRKAVLNGWTLEQAQEDDRPSPRRGGRDGGRGGRDRRGGGRGRGDGRRDRRR